jgi:hypothetical protein
MTKPCDGTAMPEAPQVAIDAALWALATADVPVDQAILALIQGGLDSEPRPPWTNLPRPEVLPHPLPGPEPRTPQSDASQACRFAVMLSLLDLVLAQEALDRHDRQALDLARRQLGIAPD